MFRWLMSCLTVLMMMFTWGSGVDAASAPSVQARAAILIDGRTGTILYEKNAFREMDPASLTKMMTALLVIEHGHLGHLVTVSRRAANTPGSSLHIGYEEKYTRLDLLRGLLLRSGNDASVALAESDAGSVERFVAEMNVKAQRIGAFNTQFENPNGLTKPGHYSSAYDLAVIARYALKFPLFQSIVSSQEMTVTEQSHHMTRTIHSTNQLLYGFPGADGVKTGTTNAAGKCLVASATRNGRQLIAVVLDSPDRWGDARDLLTWGFRYSHLEPVLSRGQVVGQSTVIKGQAAEVGVVSHKTAWVALAEGERPTMHLHYRRHLTAPVSQSAPVGLATIVTPYQPALPVPLYTKNGVLALRWYQQTSQWFKAHF